MKVAVVGAGISGLTAAWRLQQAGVDVVVLEREHRPGGVIVSERPEGEGGRWVVEGGPDGWLAADGDLAALAREVGIADRMVAQAARGTSGWDGARLRPLAEGEAARQLGFEVEPAALRAGFQSFKTGMADIVEALVAGLQADTLRRADVTTLHATARGYRVGDVGVEVDGVILAIAPIAAGPLLRGSLPHISYQPSLSVSVAYRQAQIAATLEGSGFLTAPETRDPLRACTYASRKFPGRAPDGGDHVLLRAFLAWQDADARSLAHARLSSILGISGDPLWAREFRWPRGIPAYDRGHAERLAEIRTLLLAHPPLALCGSGYDGPGLTACVRSAIAGVQYVLQR